MNPIIKGIAKEKWGEDWFEMCTRLLSKDIREKTHADKPWDVYRLASICILHPKVFNPAKTDALRELHR